MLCIRHAMRPYSAATRRHVIASLDTPPWGEGLALLRVCRALALQPDPPTEPLAALLHLVAAR